MTPWTAAHQVPLSMGFSRQEHWSGLPFLPPGDLPDPGIETVSHALAGRFFTTEPPGKPPRLVYLERNEVSQSPVGDAGDVISMDHEELQLRQSSERRFRQSLYAIKPRTEKNGKSFLEKKKKIFGAVPTGKNNSFFQNRKEPLFFFQC